MLYSKYISKSCFRVMTLVLAVSFLYIGSVCAAPKPKKEKITGRRVISEAQIPKTVTGTISYVDGKYIAVVYSFDKKTGVEKEIGFWLNEEVTFSRVSNAAGLNVGDTIEIEYEEMQQEVDYTKEDKTVERKTRIKKFEPKVIKFRNPAKSKLRSK